MDPIMPATHPDYWPNYWWSGMWYTDDNFLIPARDWNNYWDWGAN